MNNIAIIPARGGSKRIPRKNIKEFCGQPIIAWSIQAAIESRLFSKVVVSTDDPEIASISRAYNAETPFLRPADLADDYTPTVPVINHALQYLEENGESFDYVCCLYATAPFVSKRSLEESYQLISKSSYDYVFPITEFPFSIQRALRVNENGALNMLYPEHALTRSQDLEVFYHDAGQFYWGYSSIWKKNLPLLNSKAKGIKLTQDQVRDIDTIEDWLIAESLFKRKLVELP